MPGIHGFGAVAYGPPPESQDNSRQVEKAENKLDDLTTRRDDLAAKDGEQKVPKIFDPAGLFGKNDNGGEISSLDKQIERQEDKLADLEQGSQLDQGFYG